MKFCQKQLFSFLLIFNFLMLGSIVETAKNNVRDKTQNLRSAIEEIYEFYETNQTDQTDETKRLQMTLHSLEKFCRFCSARIYHIEHKFFVLKEKLNRFLKDMQNRAYNIQYYYINFSDSSDINKINSLRRELYVDINKVKTRISDFLSKAQTKLENNKSLDQTSPEISQEERQLTNHYIEEHVNFQKQISGFSAKFETFKTELDELASFNENFEKIRFHQRLIDVKINRLQHRIYCAQKNYSKMPSMKEFQSWLNEIYTNIDLIPIAEIYKTDKIAAIVKLQKYLRAEAENAESEIVKLLNSRQ